MLNTYKACGIATQQWHATTAKESTSWPTKLETVAPPRETNGSWFFSKETQKKYLSLRYSRKLNASINYIAFEVLCVYYSSFVFTFVSLQKSVPMHCG